MASSIFIDAAGGFSSAGGSTTASGPVLFPDGTAAAPSMAFATEPGLGFFKGAPGYLAVANDNGLNATMFTFGTTSFNMGSGTAVTWGSAAGAPVGAAGDTALARTAAGKISLTGTTPMLQFGGTTASFPAIKQSGTNLLLRLADDTGSATVYGNYGVSGGPWISAGVPTISSGFGAAPAPSVTVNNGTGGFIVNVGGGGTATSGVIGLPTATTGWIAFCLDITACAGHTALQTVQTASTANSVTIESQNRGTGAASAWAASSLIRIVCFGY